jgi:hypothetical protein
MLPPVALGLRTEAIEAGAIADVLLLPYWLRGAIISRAILALLWWNFRLAFRR